ncbi:hypothetical protein [Rhizobium sp. CG5]|uniref:hypothetical protein n=1 Tax=Rhizobium sp. CG5 TaxID=2726076 RepID=UPI0020348461|nr:hypothetical protein [Rhizobium sp. CG5]
MATLAIDCVGTIMLPFRSSGPRIFDWGPIEIRLSLPPGIAISACREQCRQFFGKTKLSFKKTPMKRVIMHGEMVLQGCITHRPNAGFAVVQMKPIFRKNLKAEARPMV